MVCVVCNRVRPTRSLHCPTRHQTFATLGSFTEHQPDEGCVHPAALGQVLGLRGWALAAAPPVGRGWV
jgi:hypothetical protein